MDTIVSDVSDDADEPVLRGPQVCRLASITYRQLDYWARNETLVPAVPARGSGSQRLYTLRQAAIARIHGYLSLHGANRRVLSAVLDALDDPAAWDATLVVTGDGVVTPTVTPAAYMAEHALTVAYIVNPAAALAETRQNLVDLTGWS